MGTGSDRDAVLVVRVWHQDDVVRGRLLSRAERGDAEQGSSRRLLTVATCAGVDAIVAAVEAWLRAPGDAGAEPPPAR